MSSTYSSVVLGDAPLAYYRMDESSGTTLHDSSGNLLNGTLNGGFTLSQTGAIMGDPDTAMLFNGSSGYAALPAGVTQGTKVSLECWFKLSNTTFATFPRIIADDNAGSSHHGIEFCIESHGNGFFANLGFTSSSTTVAYTGTSFTAGTYYHIATTYDGTTCVLYLNGASVTSTNIGSTLAAGGFVYNIARNPGSSSDFFPGTVDEVAIYGTALSATQVLNHYNAGTSPNVPAPLPGGIYTVINGFDHTLNIDIDGIKYTGTIDDQQAKATIDIEDEGSQFNFACGQEVIVFDGTAMIPSHNIITSILWNSGWTAINALAGNFTLGASNTQLTFTFSNSTGQGLYLQESPNGYVHVGQSYMLSVYTTISTPLTNGQSQIIMQFLDLYGNALSTMQTAPSTTTNNARQQISVSGVAPAGSVFVQALLGGITTVNGSNSGTIVYDTPQIEPMWFTDLGVNYPTPDTNNTQTNCAVMPDNTVSRMCRVFAGIIDDWKIPSYEGINRTWELEISPAGVILEDGNINASYESEYDDQIISNIITNYFSGLLNISTPPNTSISAAPVIRGALIDSISYNDNSLKEVLNGLINESSYMFYVDWYYSLRYNPSYYSIASFSLTDQTPDNITTFSYYEYQPESDGTQRKKDIKVTGGKFIAPAITDTFSGNGSTFIFTLSQQPYTVSSVIVAGSSQKTFFKGTGPTLGSGGYTAQVDKTTKQLQFSFNPASGSNNVTCTYTYETPVSVRVIDQDTTNLPVAPAYAIPAYAAKVNDTNILSITAAIQRGLSEITQWSKPLSILTLKSAQYIQPGYAVFFTSTLDNVINQPYVVQQLDFTYKGNGLAEYAYTLGAYRPHLLDHIRNSNKAVNRSKTTLNVNTPQQTDLVFIDTAQFSDAPPTFTLTPANPSTYGTGVYGSGNTYS